MSVKPSNYRAASLLIICVRMAYYAVFIVQSGASSINYRRFFYKKILFSVDVGVKNK